MLMIITNNAGHQSCCFDEVRLVPRCEWWEFATCILNLFHFMVDYHQFYYLATIIYLFLPWKYLVKCSYCSHCRTLWMASARQVASAWSTALWQLWNRNCLLTCVVDMCCFDVRVCTSTMHIDKHALISSLACDDQKNVYYSDY